MSESRKHNPESFTSPEWDQKTFANYIYSAAKESRLLTTVEKFPKKIGLDGKIGEICNDLMEQTLADSKKREHAKYAKINLDGNLEINKDPIIGTENNINTTITLKMRNLTGIPQYRESERYAFTMHTHGSADVPPSPQDFIGLISDMGSGEVASIIITPTARLLILRSLKTPEMDKREAEDFVRKMTKDLMDFFDFAYQNMINDTRIRVSTQKNMEFVTKTCKEYDLALYASINEEREPNNNIYTKVSA